MESRIREKLRNVEDPEFRMNIVDMGLIYGIEYSDGLAEIRMTLTTRVCPLRSVFRERVAEEASKLEEVGDVKVELTFDPPWTPEKMSEKARDKLGDIPGHEI